MDRANLQKEVSSLKSEINRISESANYNGINLLDGSLAKNDAAKINFDTVSTTKGMTLETGANGAGAKGEYTIDLSKGLFGTGDKINIKGVALDGTADIGSAAGVDFEYGTDIKGSTAEEQAKSLADALNKNVGFAQNFDIKVDGAKVSLISKEEGAAKSSITSAKATDVTVALGAQTDTAATATIGMTNSGWNALFGTGATGTGTGYVVQDGDTIEFNFKDVSGKELKAQVKITGDMIDSNPGLDKLTQAIVDKLNNTNFQNVEGTAADETLLKVSDMFTLTANNAAGVATGTVQNGSIHVDSLVGGSLGAVNVTRKDGTVVNPAGGTVVAGTAATVGGAQEIEIAQGTNNFSDGDVFSISGTLSDGRNFTVELTAGKDFAIGMDYEASAKNIVDALNNGKAKAIVGTGANAQEVSTNTIFGTSATNSEFSISAIGGAITLTNQKGGLAGKGAAGTISNVNLTTTSKADTELTKTKGIDQDYASSNIKLDKDLQYGSALKIGDKTFEFVKDARDVTSRNNIAVVVDDIENASAADIAKKLTEAAKANGFEDKADMVEADGTWDDAKIQVAKDSGKSGIISFSGNEVTITGLEKGSAAKAPKLSTLYGDKVNVAEMKFDPSKLNYGDQFSINGKTYEFVANEDDASEGSIGVVVEDMKNASAKDVATALADVAQGVKSSVGEDGTITIQSMADADGNIAKPSIVFEGKGLSLQVGDTNKDYQRVNVKINSMSAEALDIDDIDIGTQEGAAAAIDKVKAAINTVSSTRGDLGAIQNRLEHTINNLGVTTENMTAAESRIRDTDMAKEMMEFTKNNILVQASQAMLAQANQLPQGVLQLLQ